MKGACELEWRKKMLYFLLIINAKLAFSSMMNAGDKRP
jgi:hypothetical protein